jgi:hypothetical protein
MAAGINRARGIDREVRLQRGDFFAAIGDNHRLLAGRAHPLAGLGLMEIVFIASKVSPVTLRSKWQF